MKAPGVIALVLGVVIAGSASGQAVGPILRASGLAGARDGDGLEAFELRLAALEPSRPIEYFELAEEIAAETKGRAAREQARTLYTLALNLAQRRAEEVDPKASPEWLPASACFGLAALADTEQDRRWLTALAGTLAPAPLRPATGQRVDVLVEDGAALELATAIGFVRSGEGRRAMRLLEKPSVSALLARYEGLLSPGGLSGGGQRIRGLATRFPSCPECRNRRYIKNADGVLLCPTCRGRPGPKLSVAELIGQLRLESMLLNGIQRSWAAQTVADNGAPLRELDPLLVADFYRVNPDRAWWRDGRWVDLAAASAGSAGDVEGTGASDAEDEAGAAAEPGPEQ